MWCVVFHLFHTFPQWRDVAWTKPHLQWVEKTSLWNKTEVDDPAPPYCHLAISEMWCWSGGRRILTELSLCYSIVYHYNGAQWFKQSDWIGLLILLGLALCLPCASVSLVFMVLYIFQWLLLHVFLTLPYNELSLVWLVGPWRGWSEPHVIGPWRGWLTIVLQCCDTVGWDVWPVKSSLKWPTMCRVGR